MKAPEAPEKRLTVTSLLLSQVILRSWAVDLLDDNSPTRLSEAVKLKLKDGPVTLVPPPSQQTPLDTANSRLAQRYLKRLSYFRMHNEALSVAAMCVSNPGCSPFGINS